MKRRQVDKFSGIECDLILFQYGRIADVRADNGVRTNEKSSTCTSRARQSEEALYVPTVFAKTGSMFDGSFAYTSQVTYGTLVHSKQ